MENDWVPIEGFPGYSVNPLGQVRNDAFAHGINKGFLALRINQYGVSYVGLMRDGRQVTRSLPLIVATAFLGRPTEIFDTPINLDGDRTNCSVENLMWRPRWYAVRYNQQFKEPYENPINAPVRAIDEDEVYPDSLSAAIAYGLLEVEVVMSVLNKTTTWPTYQFFELASVA